LPDAAPRGACEAEFAALKRCFLRESGLDGWKKKGGGGGAEAAGEVDQEVDGAPVDSRTRRAA
jgi:hypothetical protein